MGVLGWVGVLEVCGWVYWGGWGYLRCADGCTGVGVLEVCGWVYWGGGT